MKITVNVTQEDIERGVCGDPYQCPVTHAVRRTLPYATDISVYGPAGFLTIMDVIYKYRLPYICDLFVENFDARRSVDPISFDTDLIKFGSLE